MTGLPFLQSPPMSPTLLRVLPRGLTHSVLLVDAYLQSRPKMNGPSYHSLLARCIDNRLATPQDADRWLRQLLAPGRGHQTAFDDACRQAEELLQKGCWVATWRGERPPARDCPWVLFGAGSPEWDWPWVAAFNSRKSKLVDPREPWLTALRRWLPELASQGAGIAASSGTLTYDLLTAYAQSSGIPLLFINSLPMAAVQPGSALDPLSAEDVPHLALTCRSKAARCLPGVFEVCRDRLLAFLADIHWVLEVREGGNLHRVLFDQHTQRRRRLMVLHLEEPTPKSAGNLQLLQAFPWAKTVPAATADAFPERFRTSKGGGLQLVLRPPGGTVFSPPPPAPPRDPTAVAQEPGRVVWRDYLYHYTRSCPGPWPGQSRLEYLSSLLRNDPLCSHTALDTLLRILLEGRIRASKKVVRGERAVISWSAVPPVELWKVRRWNRALLRWTFEPYGIAVRRQLLKATGAKPVIYGGEKVYSRLDRPDRFRYQLHLPPGCLWKHEHEWRLPADLELDRVNAADGFIFVSTAADLEALRHHLQRRLPVVVVPALGLDPRQRI